MGNYKELLAFKKSYALAMEVFILSKKFPAEEKYSGHQDLYVQI